VTSLASEENKKALPADRAAIQESVCPVSCYKTTETTDKRVFKEQVRDQGERAGRLESLTCFVVTMYRVDDANLRASLTPG
jgi:hypothetical protein